MRRAAVREQAGVEERRGEEWRGEERRGRLRAPRGWVWVWAVEERRVNPDERGPGDRQQCPTT